MDVIVDDQREERLQAVLQLVLAYLLLCIDKTSS